MEVHRNHRRTIAVLCTLFILAVLIAGGVLGYFWYKKSQQDQPNPTSAPPSNSSVAIDTTDEPKTETIQTALVIPGPDSKPGDQIQVSVLSITTPTAWRAVNAKNVLNTNENNSMYITALNDVLAQLLFVPENKPADPLQAINSLSLYNTTAWLKQTSRVSGGTAVTPAMKSAWLANIENIGNGKPADPNVCKNGAGVFDMALCTNQLKATPIVTKDNSMRGVVFLNTQAQSISYDPRAFVFLTGKVKEQQLLAYGSFHLLDNASHTLNVDDLDSIKAA